MTQAFWQWSKLVNELVSKRKSGALPEADETKYATELAKCEQQMTQADRRVKEVLVRDSALEQLLPPATK